MVKGYMSFNKNFLLIVCVALLCSCNSSLVFSPSIHVPKKLNDGSAQVSAGVAAMPETVPSHTDRNYAFGVEGRAGYDFSNNVRLEAKYFFSGTSLGDTNSSEPLDHGFGGLATVMLHQEESYATMLIGQGQFVLSENTFQGGGGAIQFGVVLRPEGVFHGYAALGPVIGSYDWFENWGAGGAFNIGGASHST